MDLLSSKNRMTGSTLVLLVAVVLPTCVMTETFEGFHAGSIMAFTTHSEAKVIITALISSSKARCDQNQIGSMVREESESVKCLGGSCPQKINFTCTAVIYSSYTFTVAEYSIPSTNGTTFSIEYPAIVTTNVDGNAGSILYAKIGPGEFSAAFGGAHLYKITLVCEHEINVPIDDLGDNAVTCEFDTENCGSYCTSLTGLELDTHNCTLKTKSSFKTNNRLGVAIVVLKLKTNGIENMQMPLQIALWATTITRACHEKPKIVSPEDGECFQVHAGRVIKIQVRVQKSRPSDRILEIAITDSIGMTQTPIQNLPGSSSIVYKDVTYNASDTSNISFLGARIACITATDNAGMNSDVHCVKIFIDDVIKQFIDVTPNYPKLAILGKAFTISFTSTNKISQTQQNASLRIHHASNGSVAKDFALSDYQGVTYSEKNLTISFPDGTLAEGTYYAVLVALSLREKYCKLHNRPYEDPTVTFDVVQPLTLNLLTNFTTSGSNATILWKINRVVVSSACQIVSPTNHITNMNCSEEWTGSDLIAGKYTITVVVIDKYGFNTSVTFTWTVELIPPHVECSGTPSNVTGEKLLHVTCNCNESCSAKCRVVDEDSADSSDYETCSSLPDKHISYSAKLPSHNASYRLDISATDLYENTKVYSYRWRTDHKKPNLTTIKRPSSPSNARYIDIKFSCNEACATRCVLQNESSSMEFEDCGGKLSIDTKTFKTPYLLSLVNYTLKIIPTDAVGNEGESKYCEWTSDMDPPICKIVKSPALKSNQTAAEFGFTCSEPSTAKCSFTKQGESPIFRDCGASLTVSLKSYSTPNLLTATNYVFRVYCIDAAGNNGAIQTYEWQTDFSKPSCVFSEKPPANSSETMVKFTITCNEATRLSCAIQKGNYDAVDRICGSDLSADARTFQTKILESGYMYTFTVHSTDGAGNTGDAFSHDWHTKISTSLRARLNMHVSEDTNDHNVFQKYVNKVKGPLKASKISTIRKGSLIIDYDVDTNNWNHVLSLVEKGSVVVDGAIIPVQTIQFQRKDGEVVDITTLLNPCIIYVEYETCPTQAPCVADGNKNAKCSMDSVGTSRGVIALAVSIVAFFLLLGSVLLVIHFRKPRMKNKTNNEQPEKYKDKQNNSLNRSWYQPRFHRSRFLDSSEFHKPCSEN